MNIAASARGPESYPVFHGTPSLFAVNGDGASFYGFAAGKLSPRLASFYSMVLCNSVAPRLNRSIRSFGFLSLILFSSLSLAVPVAAKKHHHKCYSHKACCKHVLRHAIAKKTAVKKPVLIHSQFQQHMPPPGHDGEEHSDWFWQRRVWPNRTIDPKAYPTALAEAQQMPVLSMGMGKEGVLSSFEWQSIGPNSIDGRATCVATDPIDSNTFYIGAAAGGLWKTTDHGASWSCVTDTFGSLAIGCVTIDSTNPQIMYIGLGECNGSADSYPGDGLWKSTNGGTTWSYLGFAAAQYIAKVIIDPRDHNDVFVAVLGPNTLADTNKGIFRSTDGGMTWTRSLFVRPSASNCIGFIDIAMDPLNSGNVVAAAYDHSITIGANFYPGGPAGPGSGIYRSTDTGTTWERIDTLPSSGLPNGATEHNIGRIALLWISWPDLNRNQNALFAGFIRADTNPVTHYLTDENFEGLYISYDAGLSWSKALDSTIKIPMGGVQGKDSANITNAQGGYDFFLSTGPNSWNSHPADIYIGGIDIFRSSNLGSSWKDITNSYSQYYVKGNREQHSDQHGLAFAGSDLIAVSDGGAFETRDYGNNWRQITGLPITEFYTIEPWVGGMMNTPSTISASDLKVLGGTQDNGTVGHGLNAAAESFGTDSDFAWINHGDGGVSISDPADSNRLISSLQLGVIFARNTLDSLVPLPLDMRDTTHDTRPRWHTITYRLLYGPHPLTDTAEACAFVAPIQLDPNNNSVLYTGRCHVYQAILDWSDLENTTWRTWSPALFGYVSKDSTWYYGDDETIGIGPRDAAGHPMLWAGGYGTSGNIWRTTVNPTRSDTTPPHWIAARGGVPIATVSDIVPDRSDSLTAFCTIVSAANVAHVLRTTNGGKNWVNISGNLPSAPVSALVIDTLAEHGDPSLKNQILIAGTDVGVFATTDGGSEWFALGSGMPHAIVSDLKIYKNMLIAATHGRSLYALDISALTSGASVASQTREASESMLSVSPNPVFRGESFEVRRSSEQTVSSCRLVQLASGRFFSEPLAYDGKGVYRITPGPELSSGDYIVQLFEGDRLLGEGRVSIAR